MDNLSKKREKEQYDIIVLGISRGGVITADVVATKLELVGDPEKEEDFLKDLLLPT